MRALRFTTDLTKFLATLPPKQYRQVMTKVFELLKNPTPHDMAALKGYPSYRVDIGEYRIIYQYDEVFVSILTVGKRNDDEVYKNLKGK